MAAPHRGVVFLVDVGAGWPPETAAVVEHVLHRWLAHIAVHTLGHSLRWGFAFADLQTTFVQFERQSTAHLLELTPEALQLFSSQLREALRASASFRQQAEPIAPATALLSALRRVLFEVNWSELERGKLVQTGGAFTQLGAAAPVPATASGASGEGWHELYLVTPFPRGVAQILGFCETSAPRIRTLQLAFRVDATALADYFAPIKETYLSAQSGMRRLLAHNNVNLRWIDSHTVAPAPWTAVAPSPPCDYDNFFHDIMRDLGGTVVSFATLQHGPQILPLRALVERVPTPRQPVSVQLDVGGVPLLLRASVRLGAGDADVATRLVPLGKASLEGVLDPRSAVRLGNARWLLSPEDANATWVSMLLSLQCARQLLVVSNLERSQCWVLIPSTLQHAWLWPLRSAIDVGAPRDPPLLAEPSAHGHVHVPRDVLLRAFSGPKGFIQNLQWKRPLQLYTPSQSWRYRLVRHASSEVVKQLLQLENQYRQSVYDARVNSATASVPANVFAGSEINLSAQMAQAIRYPRRPSDPEPTPAPLSSDSMQATLVPSQLPEPHELADTVGELLRADYDAQLRHTNKLDNYAAGVTSSLLPRLTSAPQDADMVHRVHQLALEYIRDNMLEPLEQINPRYAPGPTDDTATVQQKRARRVREIQLQAILAFEALRLTMITADHPVAPPLFEHGPAHAIRRSPRLQRHAPENEETQASVARIVQLLSDMLHQLIFHNLENGGLQAFLDGIIVDTFQPMLEPLLRGIFGFFSLPSTKLVLQSSPSPVKSMSDSGAGSSASSSARRSLFARDTPSFNHLHASGGTPDDDRSSTASLTPAGQPPAQRVQNYGAAATMAKRFSSSQLLRSNALMKVPKNSGTAGKSRSTPRSRTRDDSRTPREPEVVLESPTKKRRSGDGDTPSLTQQLQEDGIL